MTTITFDKNLKLKKTHFRAFSDFLQYFAKNDPDLNDPCFKDTILTNDILKKAEQARKEFREDPNSFKSVI